MIQNCLIVFVRKPELGKVKTRLAAKLGEEAALKAYKQLLEITRTATLDVPADRHLWYAGELVVQDSWSLTDYQKYLQPDGDLGYKMEIAFANALAEHQNVLIVGSDCPDVSGSILNDAFESLNQHDVVLGPTEDGGYYLLGMKYGHYQLFKDISWSTEKVFDQTIQKCKALQLKVNFMPMLFDVDTEAEFNRWLNKL